MKYSVITLIITLALTLATSNVLAGTVLLCPDMSQAKQVGECVTEDEIKNMFKRTFGLECDPQLKDSMECEKYAEFKQKKYSALWESFDGEFMGYVTCNAPASEISNGKPSSVAISQTNGLYKITCNYQKGVSLSMRTRNVCRVGAAPSSAVVTRASCDGDANNCKIECD
ncbi:hypothetical protein [Sedimenticola selenatireducens]|uniref:Uncharacterized protein n=1 Tax=Sedimenticola selenatireducens TaxID=191960 RepID=A0A557S9X6_9GAMM|nr:hypothetical protein [Sedimenticola selenatireducens]TVO74213.1 hypothetical protein FHP88_10595 [Sedimenticola selenatireducens]TVT62542.1 MAG: hypothetical protein FHK78_14255 [Sedimenticola selenatireducens]